MGFLNLFNKLMKAFAAAGAGLTTLGAVAYKFLGQENPAAMTLDATDYAYMAYVTEYGKSYGTVAEFVFRSNEFRKSKEFVDAHNADPTQTHEVELNMFADRTYDEMKAMNGFIPSTVEPTVFEDDVPNASSWDWRTKEPSMKSRTKDNADHAGLSQLLVPLKVLTRSRVEDSTLFQSNNLLIAAREPTTDAKVVSWITLSNTLKLTHL